MAAFKAIAFEPPTREERLKAIEPTDALSPALKRALNIEGFVPLSAPRQQDRLAVHPEPGQAFEEFRREQPTSAPSLPRLLTKTSMEHRLRCGETLRTTASVLPTRRF